MRCLPIKHPWLMNDELAKIQKRLAQGRADAFDELFELVGDALYRFVFCRLKCPEDAADVMQETFVGLVNNHRKLGKAQNLRGYVFACARNEMIRFIKRKNRHRKTVTEDDGENVSTTDFEQWDWINATLSEFDGLDQQIIVMKVFAQLTFDDIADAVELKPSTVATRYRRAMQKLEIKVKNQVSS